jgi:hypothetical protein
MALQTNLIAYYKCDDVNDSVGSNTLTNVGYVSFGTGLIGNCADFGSNNTTKGLMRSDALGYTGGNLSISMWVKLNNEPTSGLMTFVMIQNNTTKKLDLICYRYSPRNINFEQYNGTTGGDINYNVTMGTSNWYHLVYTYDGTNVVGYVNGSSVGTIDGVGNGNYNNNTFDIGIDFNSTQNASAKVDEVGVWTKVLSQAEVTALYNNGVGLTYPFVGGYGGFLPFL